MKKEKINGTVDFIIIFLVVCYSYLRMLGMNDKVVLAGYIMVLGVFVFCKIVNVKLRKNEFYKILIFVGLISFSTIVIGEVDLLIIVLVAISFLKSDSKQIIKNFLKASIICYIFVITFYLLGITKNIQFIRIEGNVIRNSLGFEHVNQTFLFLLPIQLCLYLLYSKKRAFVNSIIIIVSTILFIFTDCRTGYACTIIFIIIYNIPFIINNNISNKIIKWLFIIFTLLSIFIANRYGDNGANKINSLLSLRPYYLKEYIDQENLINISGGNFKKSIPLDNIYIFLLEEKGIIVYLIYVYIYIYSFNKFKNSTKYKTVIIVFLIYGLFEAYIILPGINFIMILQIKNIISCQKEKNFIEEEENDERKNFCNSTNI